MSLARTSPRSLLPGHILFAALLITPAIAPGCASAPKPKPSIDAPVVEAEVTFNGIDEAALDRSIDPCTDFYTYACGGWQKATPIPDDRASWVRSFSEIDEKNQKLLKETLEKFAAGKDTKLEAYASKIGDFYASCMDEEGIEKAGSEPLKAPFAIIEKVKDAASFSVAVRDLWAEGFGVLFSFGSGQDFGDATKVIGQLEQGGIGLPDRDYYLKTDAESARIRKAYEAHIIKVLELSGTTDKLAIREAKAIMALETELAKASMTVEDRRDPKKVYNKRNRADVKKLAPTFGWDGFLDALGVAVDAPINVAQPLFLKGLDVRVAKTAASDLRAYLRFHVTKELTRTLPKAFVDEDFKFTSSALTGASKILPRWKRCSGAVDEALGEALAQPFVRETFGEDGKKTAKALIDEVERAMKRNLDGLSWMDSETRKLAQEKLAKVNNKIGYPDVWRKYDGLTVDRAGYSKNVMHARIFERKRVLAKIGKPLDRGEWYMTPPEVNAYYDANMNEMVFPAGILQPPFFDKKNAPAVNFGAIGMVMGHELTHGFDDEGRQFDGDGNLRDWWSAAATTEFKRRTDCLVKQYDGYIALKASELPKDETEKVGKGKDLPKEPEDVHVKGQLTLGENIADLGGIKLAYTAMKSARKGRAESTIAGFTEDQQFFISFAQSWCHNGRPQNIRARAATDPHAPPRYRVIGPVSNMSEFAHAFSCKADAAMVKKATDRCEIW